MGTVPRWLRKQRAARLAEDQRDRWAPFYKSNLETYKREMQRWSEWTGEAAK